MDNKIIRIEALGPTDGRSYNLRVAGPAALMVSKLHKLAERRSDATRLMNKDAHDVYRILVALPTDELARTLRRLRGDDLAGAVTVQAIRFLDELFATEDALGATLAGKAERGVGLPDTVAASASALAGDLIAALER